MNVGDPKKTAIMAIAAVGAIGFLIFQLIPKGEPKIGRLATTAPVPLAGAMSTAMYGEPETIGRDPFYHASLAIKKDAKTGAPVDPNVGNVRQAGDAGPAKVFGYVGPISSGTKASPEAGKTGVTTGAKDAPTASRKEKQEPHYCVTFLGTVGEVPATVYLSIEEDKKGKETKSFLVGAEIAPGVRLVALGDGKLRLQKRGAKTQIELEMGKPKEL